MSGMMPPEGARSHHAITSVVSPNFYAASSSLAGLRCVLSQHSIALHYYYYYYYYILFEITSAILHQFEEQFLLRVKLGL
jgi:hypothetical protein